MESSRNNKQKIIKILKYGILIFAIILITLLISASIISDILNKTFAEILKEELSYVFTSWFFWVIMAFGVLNIYLFLIYLPNEIKKRKERKRFRM